jgi:hypothetical protein
MSGSTASTPPRSPAGAPASFLIDEEALDRLQALRDALGKPLIVRSACRNPYHNRAVGGAVASPPPRRRRLRHRPGEP